MGELLDLGTSFICLQKYIDCGFDNFNIYVISLYFTTDIINVTYLMGMVSVANMVTK